MATISKIWAREILDSRGIPTIEAACQLDTGHVNVSSVPAGASTGAHETVELRDGDSTRYFGKGVLKAVSNVNQIIGPQLVGIDPSKQIEIDQKMKEMDGTKDKSKLGANAILVVSMVILKSAAIANGVNLYNWVQRLSQSFGLNPKISIPTPIFNMINGGLHGAGNLDFQEFHVIPATSKQYHEGLRIGAEVYMKIGEDLERRGAIHSVGDEGGYAPNLFTNADALEVMVEAVTGTQYQLGRDLFLGLDVAASVFFKNGEYTIRDKPSPLKDSELLEYYKIINNQYNLEILEDPFHEDAWESWVKLCNEMGDQVTIVGDDLLATSPDRVDKAIKEGACNAILVKPNQIGTVTETIGVIKKAKDASWKIIVSHRSGETNDWFIADFAVGVGADYVKFGAPARGERVAKYNRLSSIEAEILHSQQ